jgi:hypothetical protein
MASLRHIAVMTVSAEEIRRGLSNLILWPIGKGGEALQ